MAAYKAYKLAEAYIKQKKLIKTGNTLFAIKLPIQSDEINDKIDIKNSEVDIVTKASEVSEITVMIHINLTIYNITNLPTYINEFETDFIDLFLFKIFIVTKAPEASEAFKADNAIMINLIINIITELFIQSNKVLLN